MNVSLPRLPDPERVSDPEAIAAVTGPVRAIERSLLPTVGYTAARHERLTVTLQTGARRRLVVKTVRPSADWTALRTGDGTGREAAMLAEPALGAVWDRLLRAGIIAGARMLLWSKALALEADAPGASAEWAWWVERLEAACG